MILNQFVLIFLVIFCDGVQQMYGQDDCVPEIIQQLDLAENGTLWWQVDPTEVCNITNFGVNIYGDSQNEYEFDTTENYLNVSFLEVCFKWNFTVTPVSNEALGEQRTLRRYYPLPPDDDDDVLSLSVGWWFFNMTTKSIDVAWVMSNVTFCPLEYHVTIQDEDFGTIIDSVIEKPYINLTQMSPCVNYGLRMRPINAAVSDDEGPLSLINFRISPTRQRPPTLLAIDIQTTSINITWGLEGSLNRCPLTNLYVDGGSYFNLTIPLQDLDNTTAVPVEIVDLLPNRMYFFQVYVENSAGLSAPSQMAVQTLEDN